MQILVGRRFEIEFKGQPSDSGPVKVIPPQNDNILKKRWPLTIHAQFVIISPLQNMSIFAQVLKHS